MKFYMQRILITLVMVFVAYLSYSQNSKIIHDAEQEALQEQFGEQWATQDKEIDKKLKALEKKFGVCLMEFY